MFYKLRIGGVVDIIFTDHTSHVLILDVFSAPVKVASIKIGSKVRQVLIICFCRVSVLPFGTGAVRRTIIRSGILNVIVTDVYRGSIYRHRY